LQDDADHEGAEEQVGADEEAAGGQGEGPSVGCHGRYKLRSFAALSKGWKQILAVSIKENALILQPDLGGISWCRSIAAP